MGRGVGVDYRWYGRGVLAKYIALLANAWRRFIDRYSLVLVTSGWTGLLARRFMEN